MRIFGVNLHTRETDKDANLHVKDRIDVNQIRPQNPRSTLETIHLPGDNSSQEPNRRDKSQPSNAMLSNDGVCDDYGLSALGSFDHFDFYSSPPASLAANDRAQCKDSSPSAAPVLREAPTAHSGSSDQFSHALISSCTSDQAALDNTNRQSANHTQSHRTAHSKTKEECMVKLSEIFIRLFDQFKIISNSSIETLSSPSQPAKIAGSFAAYNDCKERTTPIGEVFCISQELTQVLKLLKPISADYGTFTTVVRPSVGIQSLSFLTSHHHPFTRLPKFFVL